jgi:hypothetical protein
MGAVDGDGVGVEDAMLLETLFVTEDKASVLDDRLNSEDVLEMGLEEDSLDKVATDDEVTEEDELVAEELEVFEELTDVEDRADDTELGLQIPNGPWQPLPQ